MRPLTLGASLALSALLGLPQAQASAGSNAVQSLIDQAFAPIGIPSGHTAYDNCPDFSGQWLATCQLSGAGQYQLPLSIQQRGCDFIVIEDNYIGIGGGFTTTTASATSGLHTDITADWSADRQSLVVSKTVDGRKLGEPKFLHSETTATLKLSGDQLLETGDYKVQTTQGGQVALTSNGTVNCTYARQK